MKRICMMLAIVLALSLCLCGCDHASENSGTTAEQTTEAPTESVVETTEEGTEATTEATTEEITEATTEETTEENAAKVPTRDEIKQAASAFVEVADMLEASRNEFQDWSDFGGLIENEDGSVTAVIQEDSNPVWDPYFYLIKKDTPVDNVLVIQYRTAMEYGVNLYLGTTGNAATGAGDLLTDVLYETGDEWGYLVLDIGLLAGAYDANAASLGYLRMGLSYIESGESIDIGYVAFFHTEDDFYNLFSEQ